jgi:hypothetical protein
MERRKITLVFAHIQLLPWLPPDTRARARRVTAKKVGADLGYCKLICLQMCMSGHEHVRRQATAAVRALMLGAGADLGSSLVSERMMMTADARQYCPVRTR